MTSRVPVCFEPPLFGTSSARVFFFIIIILEGCLFVQTEIVDENKTAEGREKGRESEGNSASEQRYHFHRKVISFF